MSPSPSSLRHAMQQRRSVRDFSDAALSRERLDALLWAAQGITGTTPRERTVPSAGALHPLEVYVVAGQVTGLEPGVWHYRVSPPELVLQHRGDTRARVARACLDQPWVAQAPASLVVAAVPERTTNRYGERGLRYIHMEVGQVAQNVALQAVALGLGTVSVGAFRDEELREALGIDEAPLLVLPVGVPASP